LAESDVCHQGRQATAPRRGFAAYRGNARNEAGESWQLVLMAPDKVKSFGECRKLCSR
jgi:hypothetical protein